MWGLSLFVCAVRCWRLEGARLLGDNDRLGEAVDAREDTVAAVDITLHIDQRRR